MADCSVLRGFGRYERRRADAAGEVEERLAHGARLDLLPGAQRVGRTLGRFVLEVVPLVEDEPRRRALPVLAVPVVAADRALVLERHVRELVLDARPHG